MKLELITRTDVSHVELVKDERDCLGITFKVGTQREAGPVIKKIKTKSAAERSFSIAKGDVILFLNGRSTTYKGSKDIQRMFKDGGSCVDLQLQYTLREIRISRDGVYRRQLLTIGLQKENGSFGFVLRKKGSEQRSFCVEYPFISNIQDGSQAQKSGQLQEGDRLLKIDNLSLSCLSLAEIASILQNRERAEFTFEYNIRVVNLDERAVGTIESNCKIDLEIDVPVSDLGVSLNTDESIKIHVGSIRRGSIAERCGVLSEGDIILCINETETKFLTLSKADLLLRNAKQIRKISFIPCRQTELNIPTVNYFSDTTLRSTWQKNISREDYSADSRLERDLDTIHSSPSGVATTAWKHLNTTTPVGSHKAISIQEKKQSAYRQEEDIKVMDKFQNIIPIMINLKRVLSLLTREAYMNKQNTLNQNCTLCAETQHSVKLCASCVSKINVESAQSMNALKDIIAQFVESTTNPSSISLQSQVEVEANENNFFKSSTRNMILALREKLPQIFGGSPELEEFFKALVEKIERAETSCNLCSCDTKSVILLVKKLFLLESMGDDSLEIKRLVEILKCRLLETKFICDFATDEYMRIETNKNGDLSTSENYSSNCLSGMQGRASSPNEEFHENDSEAPSDRIQDCIESYFNKSHLDTSTNHDYLKIALVENSVTTENSITAESSVHGGNNISEMKSNVESADENGATGNENSIAETSLPSTSSKDSASYKCKKPKKDNNLKLSKRIWQSFDSLFRPKKVDKKQKVIPAEYQSTPIKQKKTDSSDVSQDAIRMSCIGDETSDASDDHTNIEVDQNTRGSKKNSRTTSSSLRSNSESTSVDGFQNVHSETMEVKMTNEGDGFGLCITPKVVEDNRSVFVISAIRPNSPSHKIGILKEDDRIVAINYQKTSGLKLKELNSLKKAALSAETVTLTVEFDVVDKEKKFGTFEVRLNKTPKTGLFFEERKSGHPMVVAGILKGSVAHRCGQIFLGDKILFFDLTRIEKFDSVSDIYSKEEELVLSVQRDPPQVVQQQPVDAATASYFNPCFHCEDVVPRNGRNFVVKKSVVRAVQNIDALVLDQEVTLFRDPVHCDFGMLVGENPDNGRAYVTDIRPDGPAHQSGVIKKYDRIVQVDGIRVDKNEENTILALMSEANHKVDLLIRRRYHEETTRL